MDGCAEPRMAQLVHSKSPMIYVGGSIRQWTGEPTSTTSCCMARNFKDTCWKLKNNEMYITKIKILVK